VLIERGTPVLAVGVFFILVLLVWGCCRCCCNNGKMRVRETSDCCQHFTGLFVILLTACALCLIIVGLDADKKQTKTGALLVDHVNDLVALVDGLGR
jgi:hypothetical protein